MVSGRSGADNATPLLAEQRWHHLNWSIDHDAASSQSNQAATNNFITNPKRNLQIGSIGRGTHTWDIVTVLLSIPQDLPLPILMLLRTIDLNCEFSPCSKGLLLQLRTTISHSSSSRVYTVTDSTWPARFIDLDSTSYIRETKVAQAAPRATMTRVTWNKKKTKTCNSTESDIIKGLLCNAICCHSSGGNYFDDAATLRELLHLTIRRRSWP